MMVSTKGRYALRVMVEMATYDPQEYIPLKAIAENQAISGKYLEAIIAPLVKAGLLEGQRGKGGGYRLAKTPAEYTAGEILRQVESGMAPVACLEGEVNDCPRAAICSTLGMWEGLNKVVNDYLDSITVEDLVLQAKEKAGGLDYVI